MSLRHFAVATFAMLAGPIFGQTYRQAHPLLPVTPPSPSSWGVNFNIYSDAVPSTSDMTAVESLGSKYVRIGFPVHSTSGTFDTSNVQGMYNIIKSGDIPICIIGPEPGVPSLESGSGINVAATDTFATNLAEAITAMYSINDLNGNPISWSPSHQGIIWEVFDEPNTPAIVNPPLSASQYVEILQVIFNTIRQKNSIQNNNVTYDEWFIGMDGSDADPSFIQQCLALGACGPIGSGDNLIQPGSMMLDGVALHPYTQWPSTQNAFLNLVEQWLVMYTPVSISKGNGWTPLVPPILCTEFGYSLYDSDSGSKFQNVDDGLDAAVLDLQQYLYQFDFANGSGTSSLTSTANTGYGFIGLVAPSIFDIQDWSGFIESGQTKNPGDFGLYNISGSNHGLSGNSLTSAGADYKSLVLTSLPSANFSKRIFLPEPTTATNQLANYAAPTKGGNYINVSPFNSTNNPQFDLANSCLVFNNVPNAPFGTAYIDWEMIDEFGIPSGPYSWQTATGIAADAEQYLPNVGGSSYTLDVKDLNYLAGGTTTMTTGPSFNPIGSGALGASAPQPGDQVLATFSDPMTQVAGSIPAIPSFIYANTPVGAITQLQNALTPAGGSSAPSWNIAPSGSTLYVQDDINSNFLWNGNPNCLDVLAPPDPSLTFIAPADNYTTGIAVGDQGSIGSYAGAFTNWFQSGTTWIPQQSVAQTILPVSGSLQTGVTTWASGPGAQDLLYLPAMNDETGTPHVLTFSLVPPTSSSSTPIVQKCVVYIVPPNAPVAPTVTVGADPTLPSTFPITYGPLGAFGVGLEFSSPKPALGGGYNLTAELVNPGSLSYTGEVELDYAGVHYIQQPVTATAQSKQDVIFSSLPSFGQAPYSAPTPPQGPNFSMYLMDKSTNNQALLGHPVCMISAAIARLQELFTSDWTEQASTLVPQGEVPTFMPSQDPDDDPWGGTTTSTDMTVTYYNGPITVAGDEYIDVISSYASSISYANYTGGNNYSTIQQGPIGFGVWIKSDGKHEILGSKLCDSAASPNYYRFTGAFINGQWNPVASVNWPANTWAYVYFPYTPNMSPGAPRPTWPLKVFAPLQLKCPTFSTSTLTTSIEIWGPTLFSPAQ